MKPEERGRCSIDEKSSMEQRPLFCLNSTKCLLAADIKETKIEEIKGEIKRRSLQMLTAKENLREAVRGGNPDRFVNQYEAVQLLFHPLLHNLIGNMVLRSTI